jgi:excinuclease ABC subunit C
MNSTITSKIKNSPNLSGVYLFVNKNEIVYIGKASNLKERLKSYLDLNNSKNQTISHYASDLKWIITENDVEALILESKLIKKHLPRVNVVLKDNKNYFFVKISDDIFPKISIIHRSDNTGSVIGPFTSGTHLKQLLNLLRPVFPYCNCKTKHKKPCLSSQLNLCLGFCCLKDVVYSKDQQKQYLNNIKSITKILSGDNNSLTKDLKKQIALAVANQNFEKAQVIKNQILALENIFKHRQFIDKTDSTDYSTLTNELQTLFKTKTKIKTIEMYDVSNISGKFAVSSLVMFSEGIPDKANYKKFKIKYTKLEPNDILMLKEVFQRRVLNPQ